MERAVADGLVEHAGPLTRNVSSTTGHVSPSGVFGDPTLADWRKGEKIAAAMVAAMVADIDALAAAPPPSGTPGSPLGEGSTR
jgi:creatinine amidohydrolase/Fe(II)-dependent formamide hydrolase-like protein